MHKFPVNSQDIRVILRDKDLAKFGDVLVNFIYSLAKSFTLNRPYGSKVSGKILANAIKTSLLKTYIPSRSDTHTLGDFTEAIIAYTWLSNIMSIDEMAEILKDNLSKFTIVSRRDEIEAASFAFRELLNKISLFVNEGKIIGKNLESST